MRNALLRTLGIALLATVLAGGSGCIFEDKVLQVVLSNEICAEFKENHGAESWTNSEIVDYADEVNQILEDNGYSRSDIDAASLVSAHYGVTSLPPEAPPWTITGKVEMRRTDQRPTDHPWTTVVDYSSVALGDVLNEKVPVPLNQAGVDSLNQALADFIDGDDPEMEFRINNGDVTPDPSDPDNRIIFDWKVWLLIQVVIEELIENVPDPF